MLEGDAIKHGLWSYVGGMGAYIRRAGAGNGAL
jgi:hypothetical protein